MFPEATPLNSTDGGCCFLGMIPIEILTESLMNLDFRDIFRVRKTCKLLREAANMPKPYWVNLLYQHAWQLPLKLERPLDIYSAEEVERLALQWITADMGWSRPIRERSITLAGAMFCHLVEGGRWLLVVTDTGSISYFDLEDPQMKGRVLIPDQTSNGVKAKISMDVDIDPEESILTFNLGLHIQARSRPGGPRTAMIRIIHVVLELDLDNRGIGLSATTLGSFFRETRGEVRSVSLIGKVFSYLVSNAYGNFVAYIVIINWVKAVAHVEAKGRTSLLYMKRVIYIEDDYEVIRLVPGSKILAVQRRWEGLRLRIYDVLELPVRKTPVPDEMPETTLCFCSALIQTGKQDPYTFYVSKPYRFPAHGVERGLVRLMVRAQDGLHALDITLPSDLAEGVKTDGGSAAQHNRNDIRGIVRILPAFLQKNGKVTPTRKPKTMREFFGTRRGITICEDNSALVFKYPIAEEDALIGEGGSPPSAGEHTQTTCFALSESQRFSNVCADERSGRVVLFSASGQEMVVLDFALMYRGT